MYYEIVKLPAYRAVGLKWQGSYSEVSNLKKIIHEMSQRAGELEHAVEPDIQLGLSYHLIPEGFVHYSTFEVNEDQEVPQTMVEIKVPEMTFLKVKHEKGQDIGHTYTKIHRWFKEEHEYSPLQEEGTTYFDEFPIKHERYPMNRDLSDPHFEILIPLQKRQV